MMSERRERYKKRCSQLWSAIFGPFEAEQAMRRDIFLAQLVYDWAESEKSLEEGVAIIIRKQWDRQNEILADFAEHSITRYDLAELAALWPKLHPDYRAFLMKMVKEQLEHPERIYALSHVVNSSFTIPSLAELDFISSRNNDLICACLGYDPKKIREYFGMKEPEEGDKVCNTVTTGSNALPPSCAKCGKPFTGGEAIAYNDVGMIHSTCGFNTTDNPVTVTEGTKAAYSATEYEPLVNAKGEPYKVGMGDGVMFVPVVPTEAPETELDKKIFAAILGDPEPRIPGPSDPRCSRCGCNTLPEDLVNGVCKAHGDK
jgi:hypothetical protein